MLPEFNVWLDSVSIAGELQVHDWAERAYIENRYCLGGTVGNWMNTILDRIPPSPKTAFIELDKAIELIDVDVNHRKRKSLEKLIVIDKENEGDWYGGMVTYHVEKVNLFRLWMKIKYNV